jgi:hypothetical protein
MIFRSAFGLADLPQASLGILVDLLAQQTTGPEGDHLPSSYDHRLPSLRIAPRAGRLGVNLKVAKPRDLLALALSKFSYNQFKKSINKVLGFPLVQAQLVKQSVSQLSLGQGCGVQRVKVKFHE